MTAQPDLDWFMAWKAVYEACKLEFLAVRPQATPEEIEAFCKKKAEELGL